MNTLDSLMRKLRRFSVLRLLLHLMLIVAAVLLGKQAAGLLEEKYLFSIPVVALVPAAGIAIAVLAYAIAVFLSDTPLRIARRLDRRFSLKDRMTTYVEFRDTSHPFLPALVHETSARIETIPVWKTMTPGRGTIYPAALCLIPALLVLILPHLPVPESVLARKADLNRIRAEARRLETEIAALKKENPSAPELKKLLEEASRTVRQLQKPETDRAEALKKLNALQNELRNQQERLSDRARESLAQKLEQMKDRPNGPGKHSDADRKQAQQLAKELQEALGTMDPGAGRQIGEQLQNRSFSREEMRRLQKALEDYKAEKEQSEKIVSSLQKSLEKGQKNLSSGSKVTYDSQLSDRQMEKSKGGVEDGPGTTNKDIGPQHFDTRKKGTGEYAEDRTKAEYEKLYKGEREEAGTDPLLLDSNWNKDSDPRYIKIRTFGLESDPTVTPGEAPAATRSTDESQVRKEKIPVSYQQIVKKYFESIQQ